jgi:hypothetical protein
MNMVISSHFCRHEKTNASSDAIEIGNTSAKLLSPYVTENTDRSQEIVETVCQPTKQGVQVLAVQARGFVDRILTA